MAVYQFSLLRPVAITDTGTFTRNHASTYWDSTGTLQAAAVNAPRFGYDPYTLLPTGLIIEAARTNTIVQSNNLASASWNKLGTATVTGAQYTSKGISLDRITRGGTATGAYVSQSIGSPTLNLPYTASLIVRSDGVNTKKLGMRFQGTYPNRVDVLYDPVTDTVTSAVGGTMTGLVAGRDLLSDGNVLVWVQGTPVATEVSQVLFGPTDATSAASWEAGQTVTSQILAGELQFEQGVGYTSRIRTTTVAVTRPADVNTQMMTSSVAEPATVNNADPIIWTSGMTITAGTQVYRAVTNGIHKIYQRLTAGPASSTPPESDTTNWVYVKPTNRWAMFDAVNETQTQNANDIVVVLQPGQLVDSLMFDNLEGDSIRVQVLNSSYDMTIQLKYKACSNWFQYFFEPYSFKKTAVFTGLPLLTTNVIMITIRKAASVAKAGTCVLGLSRPLGYAEPGATVGIIDYSSKTVDQFGSTTVVQRSYSKRMNVSVIIQNADLDAVQELLANYRAQPVAWIGAGNLYSALSVYGYYRSFDIVIAYPTQSRCNLEIEGLI